MSTHLVTLPSGARQEELRLLCLQHLREPNYTDVIGGQVHWVYEPDLSPAEAVLFQNLHDSVQSHLGINAAEWERLKSDIATIRAFRTRTSAPTNQQVLDTLDSIIDVLRAMVRS